MDLRRSRFILLAYIFIMPFTSYAGDFDGSKLLSGSVEKVLEINQFRVINDVDPDVVGLPRKFFIDIEEKIMKIIRHVGSIAFVLALFIVIFIGIPWYMMVSNDPVVPWWLKTAIFCLLGGILLVLATLVIEQKAIKISVEEQTKTVSGPAVLLLNTDSVPSRNVTEILGLVQGHTVFAIWLGKDLSAIVRLILGGELTEYTEMMGNARSTATDRMTAKAAEMDADAVINIRYMTTSVIGSAAELLVYGTAVKLSES